MNRVVDWNRLADWERDSADRHARMFPVHPLPSVTLRNFPGVNGEIGNEPLSFRPRRLVAMAMVDWRDSHRHDFVPWGNLPGTFEALARKLFGIGATPVDVEVVDLELERNELIGERLLVTLCGPPNMPRWRHPTEADALIRQELDILTMRSPDLAIFCREVRR